MAAWTLEQAKGHLEAWMAADLALATGKEYRIGSRMLQRSDASEIKERISFWAREVRRLQQKTTRTRRVIPID